MPPNKWDDEESESEKPVVGRGVGVSVGGKKWDDEEDEDIPEAWDAESDSDDEEAKAAKLAAAEKKKAAEAASKKSRTERIAEKQTTSALKKLQEEEERIARLNETPEQARKRIQEQELAGDMKHAEDLFSGIELDDSNIPSAKPASAPSKAAPSIGANNVAVDEVKRKAIALADPTDASKSIDLSLLPIFNPTSKAQFTELQNILAPLLTANKSKGPYPLFVQELTRLLVKDMSSEQIRKVTSLCTTLTNEKLREEKAADKGKKGNSKAAKKTTLAGTSKVGEIDTRTYDNFDDDDFM